MIVVDTNILLYATVRGDFSQRALRWFKQDPHWCAPLLWRSEYRNVMAGHLRRSAMTRDEVDVAYAEACRLVQDNEREVAAHDVFDLVETSDCTAYDCEFVALAKRLGCPLVTMDKKLLHAFPDVAVPLPS